MEQRNYRNNWPQGKDFAFTIFDDTDRSTLENVRNVYQLLSDYGFRTTKSVWPIRGNKEPLIGGSTCEEQDYLEWINSLKKDGFEIALHNATFHSSLREETIRGIERFCELFGHYPNSLANHADCQESIYWGNYRFTGFNEFIYNILMRYRHNKIFRGHIEGDKFFWGDICKDKIKYVRNFVYSDINTLKTCPYMPYHDPKRPYVNYWFASAEGANIKSFNQCISEKNQDRLEEEGGACIMYTHFANGFYKDGKINSRFKFLMKRLSKKNGWFVPTYKILDYLLDIKGHHDITYKERKSLEQKWLLHKIRVGTT
jgi:hypothetical protein